MIVSFVQRHSKFIAVIWTLFVAAGLIGATQLNDAVKAGGFNDPNGQSFVGQDVNRRAFHDSKNELSVVLKSSKTIDPTILDTVANTLTALPQVSGVADGRKVAQLASDSGQTQIVQVGINADNTTAQNLVPVIRTKISEALDGTEADSHVTGAAAEGVRCFVCEEGVRKFVCEALIQKEFHR